MVARGGGAIDFSIKTYPMESFEEEMLVLNINVNTQDAMGANLAKFAPIASWVFTLMFRTSISSSKDSIG